MTPLRAPRHDILHLWYLGDPAAPRYVGILRLVSAGKGVSLQYGPDWLASGFPLSEDLPLTDVQHMPRGRLTGDGARAVGAVDDARPDRWGQKVIRVILNPDRRSLMEYLFYAGDDRFGALSVSTSGDAYTPYATGVLPRLEQVEALSQVVAKIEASEELSDQERKMIQAGGSIGGAKPKALIDVARVIGVVAGWRDHFAREGVSPGDMESLAQQIDGDGLLAQRDTFSPADYTTKRSRPRRSGPFSPV